MPVEVILTALPPLTCYACQARYRATVAIDRSDLTRSKTSSGVPLPSIVRSRFLAGGNSRTSGRVCRSYSSSRRRTISGWSSFAAAGGQPSDQLVGVRPSAPAPGRAACRGRPGSDRALRPGPACAESRRAGSPRWQSRSSSRSDDQFEHQLVGHQLAGRHVARRPACPEVASVRCRLGAACRRSRDGGCPDGEPAARTACLCRRRADR